MEVRKRSFFQILRHQRPIGIAQVLELMRILKPKNQEQAEIVSNNNKIYEFKEIKRSTEFQKHKKHNKFEESKELKEVNESKQSEDVKRSKEVEEPKEAITKESQ